ncbi:MAG: hypothetical protein IPF63_10335 [Bacteroidetes bacterium]|nr:hypothetical protein [Bacteroidota bacterium]
MEVQVPQHSSYFKFTTDSATNFCDDYYIYIQTDALAKLLPSGTTHGCVGLSASVSFNMSLHQVLSGGTFCTTGPANDVLDYCKTWNDCGSGGLAANETGPHGNSGLINDTIWFNLGTGDVLLPKTTYYIVLDYKIDNIIYESRVVLDGIIEVGRRCKGRTWEYAPASITTNQYCTDRTGWRHYYDPKGAGTADDKYVFSLDPNGNKFNGTVSLVYNPSNTFYSATNGCIEASWVMRRYWNFKIDSGSIADTNPVNIRFIIFLKKS